MSEWRTEYTISMVGVAKKDSIFEEGFEETPFENTVGFIYERIDDGVVSMMMNEEEGKIIKIFLTDKIFVSVNLTTKVMKIKNNDEKQVVLFSSGKKLYVGRTASYRDFIASIKKRLIHYNKEDI